MDFIKKHIELIPVVLIVILFIWRVSRLVNKAKKIDREGIVTDAVVSRIEETYDPDTASSGYTTYVRYMDENNTELESPMSLDISVRYTVGMPVRIRYIPGETELVRPAEDA